MLRLGSTVVGVADLARALAFWTAALDYVRRDPDDGDTFVVLVPRGGTGPAVSLMVSESPPEPRPRVHLDLYADDQAAEVERLVALGASRVDWDSYPPDPDFVVLSDPDGNPFCVIDKSA
ncbi:MAG TPA: VOC family protein [Frankiaceae bacterium]|nr:VOC family protein [Frankiaceae bacterium]